MSAKWEYVAQPAALGEPFKIEGQPGVRRLAVPGGFLYQVQRWDLFNDQDGVEGYEWHAPVFVPVAKAPRVTK